MNKILVAEDDRGTHRLLQSLLSKWGYEVVSAYDGYEALEILQKESPPNLILLDRIMPGIDGDEVCKRIRESKNPEVAHVIYLTVKDTKDEVVCGLDGGANDYITKPFHENELRARVDVGKRLVELQLQLKKSLAEREILIREVHHRVKNNLNIILSLIHLEQDNPEKSSREVLNELSNRIHSIYGVHEKLFSQNQFTDLNFREYIEDLTANIFDSFHSKAAHVRQVLEIDEVNLGIEIVVPLGLIVTELVTNSLKYAFPRGEEGMVKISLRCEADTIFLHVGDDGISIPREVNMGTGETLGLRLVKTLTDQLDGVLTIERDGGTQFLFEFPLVSEEEV